MDNCKGCGGGDNKNMIPLAMVELHSATQERTIKRLWITIIILIGLLCATNFAWLVYESQYEDVSTSIEAEQQTDGGGDNFLIGGDFDYGYAAESPSDG